MKIKYPNTPALYNIYRNEIRQGFHPSFKITDYERNLMRSLVDIVWNYITESEEVPSTKLADDLIDKAIKDFNK